VVVVVVAVVRDDLKNDERKTRGVQEGQVGKEQTDHHVEMITGIPLLAVVVELAAVVMVASRDLEQASDKAEVKVVAVVVIAPPLEDQCQPRESVKR
jgi:hypothetical protein